METTGRKRTPPGFTLIEILVVICVITILIGLTANAASSARQKAFKAVATQECEQIAAAFKAYWLAKRAWPTSAQNWTKLTKGNMKKLLGDDDDKTVYLALDDKSFEPPDRDDGKYVDPWGNPYEIKIDPQRDIVVEEVFEAAVSFPNQFSSYYEASAPYVQ